MRTFTVWANNFPHEFKAKNYNIQDSRLYIYAERMELVAAFNYWDHFEISSV